MTAKEAALLVVLDNAMEARGLLEFWQTYYPVSYQLDLGNHLLSMAVSIVEMHKRFDEAKDSE